MHARWIVNCLIDLCERVKLSVNVKRTSNEQMCLSRRPQIILMWVDQLSIVAFDLPLRIYFGTLLNRSTNEKDVITYQFRTASFTADRTQENTIHIEGVDEMSAVNSVLLYIIGLIFFF